MRFMAIVKATKEQEAGIMPDRDLLEQMIQFNEELLQAGVLVSVEGLLPSSKGARINFNGSNRTVVDGPFTETKELVGGFWILNVKSKQEAIEWMKRCPNPYEKDIEVRQVLEMEDLGPSLTPELRAASEKLVWQDK